MFGLGIGMAITISTMALSLQDQPSSSLQSGQRPHRSNNYPHYSPKWKRLNSVLDKKIVQLKRSRDQVKEQWAIDSLAERIDKLEDAKFYLSQVQNSEERYVLSRIGGDEGGLFFSKKHHAIGIQYVSRENFMHEVVHLWQYEKNKIAYDTMVNKAVLQDMSDEVEAYKVQFAFDPSSVQTLVEGVVISSLGEITPEWVLQIRKLKGNISVPIYAQHGRVNVDMDSKIDQLEEAYGFDTTVVNKLKEVFEGDKCYRTVWVRDLKFKPENIDLSATKKIHRP